MTGVLQFRRTVTFERVVYGILLKTAARLGGAFKNVDDGRQIVIVMRLAPNTNFHEHVAAAQLLVNDAEGLGNFAVASPKVSSKGIVDCEPIRAYVKLEKSLIVVWPAGHDLPRQVALCADRVVDVGEVRPHHLVSAAKQFAGQAIALSDAEKMMAYPLHEVFSAFRTKRPPAAVLSRLQDLVPEVAKPIEGARLEDLVGYGEAKRWGLALAKDIDAWRQGELPWSDVDRGLLLSGPPGSGKTMFAGALARSCDAHLVATSVARWQAAGRLDDTLRAMRKSFEEAISHKPSILFIDEFDGIGDRARLIGTEHESYWAQVINLLLEMIDGHDRLVGVVVVGATNYPDAIDPALRRAGRLDNHIRIALPDMDERKHLARMYFGRDLAASDIEAIAAATAGFTGAQFEQAGRQARRNARLSGRAVDLESAMTGLPAARVLDGPSRRAVAVHEAGHAVVGVRLGVGDLTAVVVPRETRAAQPSGYAQFTYPDNAEANRSNFNDRIALYLAGRAAEEELLGTAYEGAGGVEGSDLHSATDIATAMEIAYGMGQSLVFFGAMTPKERTRVLLNNEDIAERVEKLLAREMSRSRDIVRTHRQIIEEVANILDEQGYLPGKAVIEKLATFAKRKRAR